MFSCRNVSRLLSDRLERSLSWLERLCLKVHLLGCGPCRRFGRAIRSLQAMRGDVGDGEQLPPEARARIQHALDEAARSE
jgi:hypothetical protein